ncbi:MAG: Gldg family protein [Planctomycetaceae bacterium]
MNYLTAILLLSAIAAAIGMTLKSSSIIRAVFLRNVVSYFSSMLGYLFIVVFVVAGGFFAYRDQFFANNLANLDQLSLWFPWLLLFIVPAITMSVWADEKKLGTDELLFTLPARDTEILMGKYLAVLAVYTIALIFSITHAFVLAILGDPDFGVLLTTFVGYWVAGAGLLAAGMVASALTSSTTVAFVLGAVICAIPVGVGALSSDYTTLRQLSVGEQLYSFSNGLLSFASLTYFGSLIGFMLYVNKVVISRRHWSAQQTINMGGQYAARIACLAVSLVSLNLVAVEADTTIDLTQERLYSLSDATQKMIEEIPDDASIHINAYLSTDLPRQYVPVRKRLVGLLKQFKQLGGSKITVRFVDIQPFSDQAEEAEQKGIVSRQVQENRGGKTAVEDIFLGVVITGADEVVIPFCDAGLPLEYELTRSLRTAADDETKRPRIGILNSDANIYGSFSFAGGMPRRTPKWQIVRELEKQYDVEQVSADSPIDRGRFDVLIAILPSSLTMPQMTNLVSYVKTGNPVLIFDDPLPINLPGSAPRQPKPPPGGGMMGMNRQQPPVPKAYGGKATALLEALELEWNYEEIAWAKFNPHPQFSHVPEEIVFVSAASNNTESFNADSPVTRGLQEVVLFFPGCVRSPAKSNLSHDPLIQTVANSGLHRWDDLIESSFGGTQLNQNPRRVPDKFAQTIAFHVKGKRTVAAPPSPPLPGEIPPKPGETPPKLKETTEEIDCIYVADIDVISDQMFRMREQGLRPTQDADPIEFDNVTFVLNSVDVLIGDTDLIPLRTRRAEHRTLSTVETAKSSSLKRQIEQQEEAEKNFTDRLQDKQSELDVEVKKISENKQLDETARERLMEMAQERKNEELRQETAEIEQAKRAKLRTIRTQTEREVRSIESTYKWAGILLPPLPAIVLGLWFLFRRVTNEQRNVSPDRRRS